MPSHTSEDREEYYKVLERFKRFCEQRGGPSWLLRLHHFMLLAMGEEPSVPAAHGNFENGPAGSRRGQPRINWKLSTFRRLTDSRRFRGIYAAAKAAGVHYQSFREGILAGRPIRGHVYIREEAA